MSTVIERLTLAVAMAGIDFDNRSPPDQFWEVVHQNWSDWVNQAIIIPVELTETRVWFFWSINVGEGRFSTGPANLTRDQISVTQQAIQCITGSDGLAMKGRWVTQMIRIRDQVLARVYNGEST